MTPRRSLDVQLNAALLDFAPKYMKDQLQQLACECDQRLERELLPQLHGILRQIDRERDAFDERKQEAARDLRHQLNLLRFDAAAIENAIGQFHAVTPRWLALFPSASSLTLPVAISSPTPAPLSTPSITTSSNGVFDDTPDLDTGSHTTASPASTPATSNHSAQESTPQPKPWESPIQSPSLSRHVQSSAIAQSSGIPYSSKRTKADRPTESDTPYKRQRTTHEKISSGVSQEDEIKERVAFPNLMTGECIFRHANRKGFFVIRCVYCEPGIFTKPPLKHNRALKHFQQHNKDALMEEMTNESIFERFALQVDGDEMASKYWIREHLGTEPHTFTPVGSPRGAPRAVRTEDTVGRYEETDDYFSPSSKLRESIRNHQLEHEGEHENLRRSSRNVPRQDYAEMIAPWTIPGLDIETTSKEVKVTRSTVTSTKRRVTKPGIKSTIGTADSNKPFGYMSEPWPRRSAPR
ncbi:hypothetical protein F5Y09DRAFT_321297 [Xylaria sp. FL1042]|nr:hypothetical protein F5Y09DRAFT_321297 [Xylaria sp. FL1042]